MRLSVFLSSFSISFQVFSLIIIAFVLSIPFLQYLSFVLCTVFFYTTLAVLMSLLLFLGSGQ